VCAAANQSKYWFETHPEPERAQPERVISVEEARAKGLLRYFTGLSCKRGHIAERFTLSNTCVECDRLRNAGNPKAKVRRQAWYDRNRALHIANVAAYTEANREKVRERRRKHHEANKERINAQIAAWAKANPGKRRAGERNRETRERGAEGSHTYAEIMALGERQGWRCAYCPADISAGWHEDHVMPIARGGTNWISNIALACQPCNQSKHARDPAEWMQEIQLKRPWRWSRGECRS
jgi:5-methylcytosine-specific restriction endonuclease McrA